MLYFVALLVLAFAFARRERDPRTIAVRAAIVWAGLGVASTEGLGALRAVSQGPVLIVWTSLTAGVVFLARPTRDDLASVYATARAALRREPIAMGMCAVMLLATLVTALASPPNNWDSLTYHLPKVEQWLQNGTLAHYPSNISTQLSLGPGAEILILNTRLLFSFALLDNLIQWTSYAVGMAAASLLARHVGAGARGQALTAVFVATLPMAVLQASSTQNDLVAACWAAAFVERVLAFRARPGAARAVEIGLALGLACVTKGTAVVSVLAFGLWLAVIVWQRGRWRARVAALALVALPVVVLNVGWMTRNYDTFGHPLGDLFHVLGTSRRTPDVAVSNLVRNVASELATPAERVNGWVYVGATRLLRGLGIDPESRATTRDPFVRFLRPYRFGRLHFEDLAASPVQMVVALAAFVWTCWRLATRRTPGRATLAAFCVCVVSGALLFCLTVKWQLWVTRFHLPLFLLAAPIAGHVLATVRAPLRWATVAAMFLVALLPALHNKMRPLVPVVTPSQAWPSLWEQSPLEIMLTQDRSNVAAYDAATTWIAARRPAEVGLLTPEGRAEYPFWYQLRAKGARPRMTHLQSLASVAPPLGEPDPDVILVMAPESPNPARMAGRGGCPFAPVAVFGPITLHERRCP